MKASINKFENESFEVLYLEATLEERLTERVFGIFHSFFN
jgi:hypothetical protein